MMKPTPIGILQPALVNRFRVRVQNQNKTFEDQIAVQVISVVADYLNRELILTIEQDAHNTDICWSLYHSTTRLVPIFVEIMSGGDQPVTAIQYQCHMKDHKFELNYANSGAAQHIVVYDIKAMIPYEPVIEPTE